ncbi:MAG: FAD-binding oxidoreductase [Candidatus Omnitrophica bacterium]|nr:FAD-binding oxidoreductase [Candidatus Omnitrophota bacterium]
MDEIALIKKLRDIVGTKDVIYDKEKLQNYSHDEFPLPTIRNLPQVAVRPHSAEEISKILRFANEEKIPITPRGGGTGLCGGCVPIKGGIVMLFENLNKVLEVDRENMMVVSEAGVMLKDLYVHIEKEGLFFPPHPGDETAMVGGVIATNAGGSRAVKHGTARNFVRALEVVLPQGDIISIGGKFIKNSTGFSLLNLFIGSEGTLGVITKAIISLLPIPKETATLIIPYDSIYDAINTVPEIIKERALPLAVEFIEADAIEFTEKYLARDWPAKGAKAYLLILLDGAGKEELERLCEGISNICLKHNAKDVFIAEGKSKQKEILDFRSQMYEAMKPNCIETLDIAVPRSEIAGHIEAVHKIEKEYGIWLPTYGHAGDGNAHTHIMKSRPDWQEVYPVVRRLIHEDARKRGGMVSGEHGVGIVKKEYMEEFLGKQQVELMRSIKKVFDPDGVLNPGKIF